MGIPETTDAFDDRLEQLHDTHEQTLAARIADLEARYATLRSEALDAVALVEEEGASAIDEGAERLAAEQRRRVAELDLRSVIQRGDEVVEATATRSLEQLRSQGDELMAASASAVDSSLSPCRGAAEELLSEVANAAMVSRGRLDEQGTLAKQEIHDLGQRSTGEIQQNQAAEVELIEAASTDALAACSTALEQGRGEIEQLGDELLSRISELGERHVGELDAGVDQADQEFESALSEQHAVQVEAWQSASSSAQEVTASLVDRSTAAVALLSALGDEIDSGVDEELSGATHHQGVLVEASDAAVAEVTELFATVLAGLEGRVSDGSAELHSTWNGLLERLAETADESHSALVTVVQDEESTVGQSASEQRSAYEVGGEAAAAELDGARDRETAAIGDQRTGETDRLGGLGDDEETRLSGRHGENRGTLDGHNLTIAGAVETLFGEQVQQLHQTYDQISQAFDEGPRASATDIIEARGEELLADVVEKGYIDCDMVKETLVDIGLSVLATELACFTWGISLAVDLVAHDPIEDLVLMAIEGVDIPFRLEFEAQPVTPFEAIASSGSKIGSKLGEWF